MARLLYVIHHATDRPERAIAALQHARAAQAAGHEVALWLAGDGVRLGVRGVAETLREHGRGVAVEPLAAFVAGGGVLHVVRSCFAERSFDEAALRPGASLVPPEALGGLVGEGWQPVPT